MQEDLGCLKVFQGVPGRQRAFRTVSALAEIVEIPMWQQF